MLAPSQVKLLSADDLPQLDPSTSAVLFPDEEAVAAEDVDVTSIANVVVVDSKWGQARGVVASDKLRGMRHVRLRSYLTSYWRRVPRGCGEPQQASYVAPQVPHRWSSPRRAVHGGGCFFPVQRGMGQSEFERALLRA